jgi:hypothetical protein
MYCKDVPFNGITSVPNFMKFYQAAQTLLVGDTLTDRQACYLINLLSFLESRLKNVRRENLQINFSAPTSSFIIKIALKVSQEILSSILHFFVRQSFTIS